jgi:intracellular septation protein A
LSAEVQPRSEGLRSFVPLFLDVFAPLAVYGALSLLDVSEFVRLGAAAALPTACVAVSALRGRRVDRMALLTVAVLILAIAVSLITGDPRILLVKSVIITSAIGLYFLATLLAKRPFIFYAAQKTVGARIPGGEHAWEQRWEQSAGFRRAMRFLTVIWGVGLLGEAAVRAAIIYTLPIAQALVVGHIWALGCLAALVGVSLRMGRRVRETVRAELHPQH